MSVPFSSSSDSLLKQRARAIRDAIPRQGLFAEKAWRISPTPFALDKKLVDRLEHLGPLLYRFQRTCDTIYRRSKKGSLPGWISSYLDAGKPPGLIEHGLSSRIVDELPGVIRPDLILTEEGFIASELDSVPGGIGLTAWLEDIYTKHNPESEIIGGKAGMITGFASIFSEDGSDILVSAESADYRPEMEWIAERLGPQFSVYGAEDYSPSNRNVYRFFELFDLPNIPSAEKLKAAAERGSIEMTSPLKPWLEEKMWAALFWSHPLREVWIRELRAANFERLRHVFPKSWVVDPSPVPHHAVLPGLEIQSFEELKDFSQKERDLVLKLSGFNERAWGARSVTIGQDASAEEWGKAVSEAIEGYGSTPFVLQEYHRGRLVKHPWLNEESGELEMLEGRVRLCPYYFVDRTSKGKKVKLSGVLATICPADKKILHGMSEAILVPCSVE